MLILFHILVPQEYRALTESRIPLKPVLGGVIIVSLSTSSHEQQSDLVVFLYCRYSLFLKDPLFFQVIETF